MTGVTSFRHLYKAERSRVVDLEIANTKLTAERDALISRIADGLITMDACRALVKRLDLNPHLVDRFVRRELQAAREALKL